MSDEGNVVTMRMAKATEKDLVSKALPLQEKIQTMKTAILHHNDADGFGAAYACWKMIYEKAIYIPVQYGQPVPELPETIEELFIVDFSYDRATCEALAAKYRLTILDHHKTAEKELAGLPYVTFNMDKSGAVLAWERMYPGRPVPEILKYVQDRDLWRFALPNSEEVNLYIASLPQTFLAWDDFCLEEAEVGGKAIKAFRDSQVDRACRNVRWVEIAGFKVPVLNLSDNISEVGNQLCQKFPEAAFSASYCDRADGKRSYSLRSIGDFDVSAIAKQFGGGGHRNAAGYTTAAAGPC